MNAAAVGQPAHHLQILEVFSQEPRLQMPGLCKIPQHQAHLAAFTGAELQMAVKLGHTQATAGTCGSAQLSLVVLQSPVGAIDPFCAEGVEAHSAEQENVLLALCRRLLTPI